MTKQPVKPTQGNNSGNYLPVKPGIPVEEGQTFQNLSQAQRDAYFRNHENNWKKRYNQAQGTVATQQTITRG